MTMTKPLDTLAQAAERWGDAKNAMDEYAKANRPTGEAWARLVGEYRLAMLGLNSAALGYATSTRAKRKLTEDA